MKNLVSGDETTCRPEHDREYALISKLHLTTGEYGTSKLITDYACKKVLVYILLLKL